MGKVIIEVKDLKMCYRVVKKENGVLASIKNLFNRQYEVIEAIKNISLKIEEGEIIGFIGPNGAGKTTFLKILSGLLNPTAGYVCVNCFTPFERNKNFKKGISLIMGQKTQLSWDIPAIETFNLNRAIYNIDRKKYNELLEELSTLLDVQHLLKTPVRQLSLGERMKMEIIASILHFPKVLFLDEPTIGLDFKSQLVIRDFIKKYAEKYKVTIIITSHYMEDIKFLCERIVIINKGEKIFDGNIENLYSLNKNYKYVSFTSPDIDKNQLKKYSENITENDGTYRIKILPEFINKLTAEILTQNKNIMDLTIENQPMESIILEILKKGD